MSYVKHGIDPEALFDRQVSSYEQLGFTDFIGSAVFNELKHRVMDAVIDSSEVNFFSLAIPDAAISLGEQLRLAGSRAFLKKENMDDTENWEQEPSQPYALLDVDDGEEYRAVPAETTAENLAAINRHAFRINELISLGLHARHLWTVNHRGLYAAGTLHKAEQGQQPTTIDLYLYGEGLKVRRDPGNISDPGWTTPHYSDRVILD